MTTVIRRGQVRDAIIHFLAQQAGWTKIADIRAAVTKLLPGVKAASIRSSLNDNKVGGRKGSALFEHKPVGFYRLRRD